MRLTVSVPGKLNATVASASQLTPTVHKSEMDEHFTTTLDTALKRVRGRVLPHGAIILLSGAPGTGKTEKMKAQLRVLQSDPHIRVVRQRIDGSNDQFTSTALREVLSRRYNTSTAAGSEGCPVLVVIDEYHMMSTQLKDELLAWFEDHPKVIL